jgi:cytochrome c biogenesis protein CcmG/thiol:disulfide interchange protein DsbE
MVLLAVAAAAGAASQSSGHADLKPADERQPAPDFALRDAAGKTATLKEYKGKVVLLDFWATWCTGCKQEIPWFTEFQRKFGTTHFAVVGVSLDEGGWAVLKPYLDQNPVPYRMLLGDQATAKRYAIQNLPDTFVIDRQGRVAAAYLGRLVNRDEIEGLIQTLLAK